MISKSISSNISNITSNSNSSRQRASTVTSGSPTQATRSSVALCCCASSRTTPITAYSLRTRPTTTCSSSAPTKSIRLMRSSSVVDRCLRRAMFVRGFSSERISSRWLPMRSIETLLSRVCVSFCYLLLKWRRIKS